MKLRQCHSNEFIAFTSFLQNTSFKIIKALYEYNYPRVLFPYSSNCRLLVVLK